MYFSFAMEEKIVFLENLLKKKDDELREIKLQLSELKLFSENALQKDNDTEQEDDDKTTSFDRKLSKSEVARYSRQLILPEIGVTGQLALKKTSILIVGAGGLGCPCAIYLAAAGVGCIGIVDYDEVELSNLHRQILHTENAIGQSKAASASTACKQLNSSVKCRTYPVAVSRDNIFTIMEEYDIVVDATDNVATRYLLNDACVLTHKPLVSGSALRFEGQLTVYNYDAGPCYRCLFPQPPPPEAVTNCSDGGVLGVVPGIIGSLQALECMKIAANMNGTYSKRLLLFDALEGTFRSIKLRGRQLSCCVCGDNPTVTELIDYHQFCGAGPTDKNTALYLLNTAERITVEGYHRLVQDNVAHILLDVRPTVEMDICALPNSINIPINQIDNKEKLEVLHQKLNQASSAQQIVVVCRRGNDSQHAVVSLKKSLQEIKTVSSVKDIIGGLHAWAAEIDTDFPVY